MERVTLGPSEAERVQLNREYLAEQLAIAAQTQALLKNLSAKLRSLTRKHYKNGKIVNQAAFDAAVANEINKFVDAYSNSLYSTNEEIMRIKAAEQIGRLTRVGMPKETVAAISKAWEALLSEELKKLPSRKWDDNITLQNRIKTVKESANTVVKAIVNKGVEQGLEVDKIVKNIEQYVSPTPGIRATPPRAYAGLRRNVRYGSIQYNALRIARTESARTYREIQTRYYDKFDFVIGYRWVLSNRHRGVDVCNSYAGNVYKSGQIPSSHPNCLCDILTVIDKAKAFGLTPEQVGKIFT